MNARYAQDTLAYNSAFVYLQSGTEKNHLYLEFKCVKRAIIYKLRGILILT